MLQYAGPDPFYLFRLKMPQNEGKAEPESQGLYQKQLALDF